MLLQITASAIPAGWQSFVARDMLPPSGEEWPGEPMASGEPDLFVFPHADVSATPGLLDRLRKGDSTAATELFALHSARLHLAVRLTFPHELRRLLDEDDIVQAVMIKAMRNLPGFSYTSPGSFRRWLLTIAGNAIRDEIKFHRSARRDHRRAEHLESAADNDGAVGERIAARQTTPSQHAMGNEAVRRLEGGLDALSADDRELLIDHLVIELDLDAIAAKHGRTREAVRVAIHRARARLAAFFDRGS